LEGRVKPLSLRTNCREGVTEVQARAHPCAGRAPLMRGGETSWAATRAPLAFGLSLWVSVCLSLYVAFWLELDNPYWAGTTAALVCQPHLAIGDLTGGFSRVLRACARGGSKNSVTRIVPTPPDGRYLKQFQ